MNSAHHTLTARDQRWLSHGSGDGPVVPDSWTTTADGWGVLCESPARWDPAPTAPSGLVDTAWGAPGVVMAGPRNGHIFTPLLLAFVLLGLVTLLHLELNTEGGPVATALAAAAGDNLAATHGNLHTTPTPRTGAPAPPGALGETTDGATGGAEPAPTTQPPAAPAAPGHDTSPAPAGSHRDVVVPPRTTPPAPPGAAPDPGPAVVAPERRAPVPTTAPPAPPRTTMPPVPRGGVPGDSSWNTRR